MGDKFRKQQNKNFAKGRDRAFEEAGKPRLFDRPESVKTIFTVTPLPGQECRVGEQLLALMADASGPVQVVRGFERIGVVEGDGGDVLRTAISNPRGPNVAELRIIGVSVISGTAKAEVVNAVSQ
jgi:hypothetical protein